MYASLLKAELNSQPTMVHLCLTCENGDLYDPGP